MPVQESKPTAAFIFHGGTAQLEPTLLRNFVLGDGHKVGDARFAGQQVVAGGKELLLFYLECNREQISALVKQKAEIHFIGKSACLVGNPLQVFNEGDNMGARVGQ